VRVQHHQAHVAACAAENDVDGAYLGVSWDGTGCGTDGAIWGGEFFRVEGDCFERVAHLREFHLPGGDAAARQGWRSAASLLLEAFGAQFESDEILDPDFARWAIPQDSRQWPGKLRLDASKIRHMLGHGVNVARTTSVGRLFDAIACIAGVAQENRFEGQAAMLLENKIGSLRTNDAYALPSGDWAPLIHAIVADRRAGAAPAVMAAKFHNALANWISEVAAQSKVKQVVLSGGVFQNRYLTERAAAALEANGFSVYTHRQVPPNDGGIALGQAVMSRAMVHG
jgi:hydrogenase maturation protein HypF